MLTRFIIIHSPPSHSLNYSVCLGVPFTTLLFPLAHKYLPPTSFPLPSKNSPIPIKNMENFSYNSSYPESVNSSPRSRDVDLDNSSWDDQPTNNNYKVKLMCSYGGRISLRPNDNQLSYLGGDTKILTVERNIKFLNFISKLSALSDSSDVCFKYQFPGEDLDALISVTNDEDLEHMMLEYDRLHRSSGKPSRLRLFVFPFSANSESVSSFGSDDPKGVGQWFVDALNSVQLNKDTEGSSPPSEAEKGSKNPDFLFGLEKGTQPQPPNSQESLPEPPTVRVQKEIHTVSQQQQVIGETQVARGEIQRQMHEEYYKTKAPAPPPPQRVVQMGPSPPQYWQERNENFQVSVNDGPPPVYLVQGPSGVYQMPSMRPVTGQVSQAQAYYHGVQRMVPDGYREQPVYDPRIQQGKVGGPYTSEMVGMGTWPGVPEGYEVQGKHMYYTQGVAMQPQYSTQPQYNTQQPQYNTQPQYNLVMPGGGGGVDVWPTPGGAGVNPADGKT